MRAGSSRAKLEKRLLGRWEGYRVFVVDDATIRDRAEYAEEFGDYGIGSGEKGLPTVNFKFIPEGEIWIAKSIKSSERHFVLDNALTYIRNIEKGMEPDAAYDAALKREQSERSKEADGKSFLKNGGLKKNPAHKDVLPKIYLRKFGTIGDRGERVDVFLIDGELVRDIYKTDYVEGGHGYVYEWIPEHEIWIDSGLNPSEIPVVVLHEFTERVLMKYKRLPYARAHGVASRVEFKHRDIFGKKDALRLTKGMIINKFLKNIKY